MWSRQRWIIGIILYLVSVRIKCKFGKNKFLFIDNLSNPISLQFHHQSDEHQFHQGF